MPNYLTKNINNRGIEAVKYFRGNRSIDLVVSPLDSEKIVKKLFEYACLRYECNNRRMKGEGIKVVGAGRELYTEGYRLDSPFKEILLLGINSDSILSYEPASIMFDYKDKESEFRLDIGKKLYISRETSLLAFANAGEILIKYTFGTYNQRQPYNDEVVLLNTLGSK